MIAIANRRVALWVALFALTLGGSAWAQGTVLTGTWLLDVQTGAGNGNPTFEIVQDGETLSGKYVGALGEAPLEGEIKDGSFEIRFKTSGDQGELNVKYVGTVESDGSIKGTLSLGELGDGTFTGTKQGEEEEQES